MPTTKSSTSTDAQFEALAQLVTDQDYRALLIELLSHVHRDGGQYTQLVGLAVSVQDAIVRIGEMRMEIANLFNERKKRG